LTYNVYVSKTLNLQQLRLSQYTKNKISYTYKLNLLHKNELSNLSITKSNTHTNKNKERQHIKKMKSDNTVKKQTRRVDLK
jgi:hypothetical protein